MVICQGYPKECLGNKKTLIPHPDKSTEKALIERLFFVFSEPFLSFIMSTNTFADSVFGGTIRSMSEIKQIFDLIPQVPDNIFSLFIRLLDGIFQGADVLIDGFKFVY